MRRAVFVVLILLAGALRADGQIPAPAPPNGISPLFSASVPTLFQWTAVNPGAVFNLIVQQRGRSPQAGLPQVNYELQISDRSDITSHVLFDITTTQTSFLFTNRYVPNAGFTNNQPFNTPLTGGTYYWRVRGIIGGVGTAFSNIQQFVLTLPPGGGGSTPVHAVGITGLAVTGQPISGVATAVLLTIQNLGTYTESNIPFVVTVNGTQLYTGATGTLQPGQSVRLSRQWIPAEPGTALIGAGVTFSGATQARTNARVNVIVDQQASILTTVVGTVRRSGSSYVLVDSQERALAVLVPEGGARVDLPSFVDQHVAATGSLTKTGDGYLFAIRTITVSR